MQAPRQFRNPTELKTVHTTTTQILTVIQPPITLPVRPARLPLTPQWHITESANTTLMELPKQCTEVSIPTPSVRPRQKKFVRYLALILTLSLGLISYLTWHAMSASAAPPAVIQQSYSNAPTTPVAPVANDTPDSNAGNIVVYILGSIAHPGVYTLPTDARMYQLVQAAGGLLPNANAVALNMAAKLTDGEEVYVLAVGETMPASINAPVGLNSGTPSTLAPGQLVNINTASEDDLKQGLHVSTATAQKIIQYRTQHGPYTSVEQLSQVVSKSIYDRIKNMVTV